MVKFRRRIALLVSCSLFLIPQVGAAATYVTEGKVSVDRCASAWFIKRFIDSDAEFVFFEAKSKPPAGISYGFFGAEYFNRAGDCTFTALVKRHGKGGNEALRKINELANDAVNWRYGPQFLGRKLLEHIADLRKACTSDADVYDKVFPTFDLLFLLYGGESNACVQPQRGSVDLIEFVLLGELLSDENANRIKAVVSAGVGRNPDQVLRPLGLELTSTEERGERAVFDDLEELLAGRRGKVGGGSVSWLRKIIAPGMQREQLDELIRWGEQRATSADPRRVSFRFQKAVLEQKGAKDSG